MTDMTVNPKRRAPRPLETKADANLVLYGAEVASRLLIGSALYASPQTMADSVRASGAAIVTVSLRREAARGRTGDQFFSIVRLGGLNNAGQVAIQTSDFRTADQKIWRVELP